MKGSRLYAIPFFTALKYFNLIVAQWLTFTFYFGRNLGLLLLVASALFVICSISWLNTSLKKGELHETQFLRIKNTEKTIQKLIQEKHALQANVSVCLKRSNKQAWELLKAKKNQRRMLKKISEKIRPNVLESRQKKNGSGKSKKIFEYKKKFECNTSINQEFLNYVTDSFRNTPYPGVESYTKYTTARLGLSSIIKVKSLSPDFGPVINDVLSFQYPISISPCQEISSINVKVFVAVISASSNFKKRDIIRNTWKEHLKTKRGEGNFEMVGFGFILGLPKNSLIQKAIEEESKIYEDIIQIGISDFYRNLSLKVAGLLNWLYRLCSKVDFVLKVDDDVYINVRNLAHFVQSYQHFNHSVFGIGDPSGGWPDRDGKWEITFEEWPWNNYPRYLLGAFVLMHGSTIVPLLAACQTTPMIPFDDLYIFGMCTEKANINLRFSAGSTSVLLGLILWIPTTCELRNLVAWRVNSDNIMSFQENMEFSHAKVNQFYQNRTHCVVSTGPEGIKSTIDHTKPVYFNFV